MVEEVWKHYECCVNVRYSDCSKEQTLSHQLLFYSTISHNSVVILFVSAVVTDIILIWLHEGTAPVVTLVHLV